MDSQQKSRITQSEGEPTPGKATAGRGRTDGSLGEFLSNLLVAACHLGSAGAGAILHLSDASKIDVLAFYPDLIQNEQPPSWLNKAAELTRESIRIDRTTAVAWSQADDPYGQPASRHILCVPLRLTELTAATAVFVTQVADEAALRTVRERLEFGMTLLNLGESRQVSQGKVVDLQRLRKAMEVLSAINRHHRFGSTMMALCNETASQWQCDRVSLGLLKGRYVRIKAISHAESFSRKMQVVQDLEAAMEECLDQDCEVIHPAAANSAYISRAAAELSKRHGLVALASLPIREGQELWGVLTLERPTDQPFTAAEVEALRVTVELCATRLAALHRQDRWIGAKLAGNVRSVLAVLLGPRHTWAKLATLAAVAAITFLIVAKGPYRAKASFVLEGTERQVVPAPFDGYIKAVYVEVSDQIRAHETSLAELDTAELRLKLAEARAEKAGYLKQMTAAMRDGETAQAQVAEANAEKAQAQVDLLEYMIAQAQLISPLTGTVVEGDLKRRIGAPVKTGDVLFEVTPLHSLRAVLHVAEDQITDIRVGQRGYLATASYPAHRIPFEVERVNPVAEIVKQENIFKVRVRLLDLYPWMRPGMEGVAKIDIDKRPYAWIWTRKLINWVRMKLWL